MADPAKLGVNLGTRLTDIATRSRVASTAQLLPHVARITEEAVRLALARVGSGDAATIDETLETYFGRSPLNERTTGLIEALRKIHPIAATPIMVIGIGMSVFTMLRAAGEPYVVGEQQAAFRALPTRALDPGSAVEAVVRRFLPIEEGFDEVASAGLDVDRYRVLTQLAQRRPEPTLLMDQVNRGVITEEEAHQTLLHLGYGEETATELLTLRFAIPGPQDVVRFAVRDVYRPEAVSRGGLLQDLPERGVEDAERAGLTRTEFEKYWASHWVLPSVTQAFAMMHRGVITENELRGLLRTQDIAPGWREELTAIAFNVISRVDIRRMYREGIADRERVYRTYLDQGYKPEDAEALTEFAVADATTDARELTKSEVVNLYEAGAVTRAQAEAMLADLGFPAEEGEWLLALSEFRRFSRFRNLAISRVRARYVARRISETEAGAALDRVGMPTQERDALVDIWDAERDVDRPVLTTAFIGGLYRANHITEEEARVRWAQAGYRSADIDLLVLGYADGSPDAKTSGGPSRQLTKADIGRALREDTISIEQAVTQWMAMGYTEAAALILARNYLPEEET